MSRRSSGTQSAGVSLPVGDVRTAAVGCEAVRLLTTVTGDTIFPSPVSVIVE